MSACNHRANWQKLYCRNLDWNVYRIRARIMEEMRRFFYKQGFLEIEAPLLTPYPSLDNNIDSIDCSIHTPDGKQRTLYLHTSPEHAMKKLLASGSGNIFSLGKVFRDKELTKLHNPEYTMAEWYRIGADYMDIMSDTQNLICHIAETVFSNLVFLYKDRRIDLTPPWPQISMIQLFKTEFGIDASDLLDKHCLLDLVQKHKIHFSADDHWETLFHRLFMEKIEPGLGFPKPVFILDYPSEMGLMAREKPEDSRFVERAELYIAGIELANGYSELTDPQKQYRRFVKQQKLKIESGYVNYPIDEELIEALTLGLPDCAGIALGVDRLVMFFLNKSGIQDILLFPI